ncbi:hypothetical protein EVA_12179 [gut metagenome]|uniref:Uncharacterized protein n=1 Tax=gut metagenome TaxID=749906 RepID=J9CI37_9ZZZZ
MRSPRRPVPSSRQPGRRHSALRSRPLWPRECPAASG